MNSTQLAVLLAGDTNQISAIKEQLPPWIAFVGITGRDILPQERVAAQEADIGEIAQKHGLQMLPAVNDITGQTILEKAINPCGNASWKEKSKGAYKDIFFTTTLDQTPKFVEAMYALAGQEGYPLDDIGIYLQPENMGTSYHCSFTLPYDLACPVETGREKALFDKASIQFSGMGAYYFRPYGITHVPG